MCRCWIVETNKLLKDYMSCLSVFRALLIAITRLNYWSHLLFDVGFILRELVLPVSSKHAHLIFDEATNKNNETIFDSLYLIAECQTNSRETCMC